MSRVRGTRRHLPKSVTVVRRWRCFRLLVANENTNVAPEMRILFQRPENTTLSQRLIGEIPVTDTAAIMSRERSDKE